MGRDAQPDSQREFTYHGESLGLSERQLEEAGDLAKQSSGLRSIGNRSTCSETEKMGFRPISSDDQLPAHATAFPNVRVGDLVHDDPGVDNEIQDSRVETQTDPTGNQEQERRTLSPVWVNQFTSQDVDPVAKLETIDGPIAGSNQRSRESLGGRICEGQTLSCQLGMDPNPSNGDSSLATTETVENRPVTADQTHLGIR
jgi:hypothetical protein